MQPKIIKVVPMNDYRLKIIYDTGETRIFNVTPYISGDWFGQLRDPAIFKTVHPAGRTVEWSGGQDIAPHELYELSIPESEVSNVG